MFDQMHGPILSCIADQIAELGGDTASLMREVGVDPDSGLPSAIPVTYGQMSNLLSLAAARLDCPSFGMRLANHQSRMGIAGPLGQAIGTAPTYGAALETITQYSYAHSLAIGMSLRQARSDETISLSHDILLYPLPDKRQATELTLLMAHLTALRLTSGRVRACAVDFRHQPMATARVYRSYFGCEVRFGQQDNAIHYRASDLDCPIITADKQAFQRVITTIKKRFLVRRPPLSAQARGIIMHYLNTEHCTIYNVAHALHLHQRTLHRRLCEEGTSFREVRDNVREDVFLYYLGQTDFEMLEISARLGFAEQSIMARWCQRRFGSTPTEMRFHSRAATNHTPSFCHFGSSHPARL